MEGKTCAFTGHRRIASGHTKPLCDLVDRALEYAYAEGCRTFLSGGALGFDTLAARRVIAFRQRHPDVRLVFMLPCENQDEKWNDGQRDAYGFLLRHADSVIYAAELYEDGCMKRRNEMLAASADMVVAYVSHSGSGSAQTVRIAERLGTPVYNLYPTVLRELEKA